MTRRRGWATRAVVVVVAGAVLAGCGNDEETVADSAPAVASALERVEAALGRGDADRARRALGNLVETTTRARAAGDLSEAQAERVLAAVARLVTALPDPSDSPEPAVPAPTPSPDRSGGEDDEDADDEKGRKDDKKDKEKGKKGKKKRGHGRD